MTAPDLVIDPSDRRLAPLIPQWDALAERTGGSYFQSGTWALSWWSHLAGEPETKLAFWMGEADTLDAVCAVSRVRRPLLKGSGPSVPVWTNTGSGVGAADHLAWPGVPARRRDVLDWAMVSTTGPMLLSNLSPMHGLPVDVNGFEMVETSPTLAAVLGQDEDWFPGSNDFRKKLRYAGRQLAKLGVELEVVGPDGMDEKVFVRLLELHAVRSEDMGWGTHFDHDRLDFHLGLIESASKAGPRACVARQGDSVVGVLYGFRFGDVFAYYQTGWSRDFVKQSLGSVLVATTMEWAAADGATTFDFLRGDDEYKRRFGAEPLTDETWLLDRGLGGKALKARQAAASLRKRSRG